jgi:hypothetical protein
MNVDNTLCSRTDYRGRVVYQLMVSLLNESGYLKGGKNYRIVQISKATWCELKSLGVPVLDDEIDKLEGSQKSDNNG